LSGACASEVPRDTSSEQGLDPAGEVSFEKGDGTRDLLSPGTPLAVRIHRELTFELISRTGARELWTSPHFADGVVDPGGDAYDGRIRCYVARDRGGSIQPGERMLVDAVLVPPPTVYSTWTAANLYVDFVPNTAGIFRMVCGRSVHSQDPMLSITFDELRAVLANDAGTLVTFEDLRDSVGTPNTYLGPMPYLEAMLFCDAISHRLPSIPEARTMASRWSWVGSTETCVWARSGEIGADNQATSVSTAGVAGTTHFQQRCHALCADQVVTAMTWGEHREILEPMLTPGRNSGALQDRFLEHEQTLHGRGMRRVLRLEQTGDPEDKHYYRVVYADDDGTSCGAIVCDLFRGALDRVRLEDQDVACDP
jgi:hypothetical protein